MRFFFSILVESQANVTQKDHPLNPVDLALDSRFLKENKPVVPAGRKESFQK
jgi:hypothetical protein